MSNSIKCSLCNGFKIISFGGMKKTCEECNGVGTKDISKTESKVTMPEVDQLKADLVAMIETNQALQHENDALKDEIKALKAKKVKKSK